jgi:hypothetical protein
MNDGLANWIFDSRDIVEDAFEVGTIRRVKQAESKKLAAALDEIVAAANPKFAFVADNKDAIISSFRWPSVTRLTPEEKTAAAIKLLLEASEGNEDLANYVVANKDAILEAYDAGVVKKTINPAALEALAKFRSEQAAAKAAAASGEPVAEVVEEVATDPVDAAEDVLPQEGDEG